MIFRIISYCKRLKKKIRKSPYITGENEEFLISVLNGKESESKLGRLWKALKSIATVDWAAENVIEILDALGVSGIPFGFSLIRLGVNEIFDILEKVFSAAEAPNCNAAV